MTLAPRRAARRALLALSVLAVVVPWAMPPAGAQQPTTGPTHLRLVRQTPFVPPTGLLELELAVTGPPADAPLAVTIERYDDVSNSSDPRDQLDAWLDGRRTPPANRLPRSPDRTTVATRDLPDAGGLVVIPIGPDPRSAPDNGFTIQDPGVFPLVVRLHTVDGRELGRPLRTFLIRLPEGTGNAPPLRVGTVLGLRAPVALKPDGSRQLTDDDRARLQTAQSVLASHPTARATVDPQPETIAALDDRGATLTISSLRTAIGGSRTTVASPFVDIDIEGLMAAGLRDQVERQRQIGLDALVDRGLGPATDIDATTLVARHPIGPEARAALQGMAPTPVTRLVVPAEHVGSLDSRASGSAGADAALQPFDIAHPGGRMRAVLSDERLSRRLTATDDPMVNAQAALADLTILACGSRNGSNHCKSLPRTARGVALVVPDDRVAAAALGPVLTALSTENPLLEDVDLPGLFDLAPASATRSTEPSVRAYPVGGPNPADLGGYAARLIGEAVRVSAYRSMLAAPPTHPETAPTTPSGDQAEAPTVRADRLIQLLDVSGATTTPEGPDPYLDEVARRLDTVFGAIHAPTQVPIRLTSPDLEIQVRVENSLDHAVTVQLQLLSDKPLFSDSRSSTTVLQTLPAAVDPATPSASTVSVPVHTVTSGVFAVDVRVLSPDGAITMSTTELELRSTVVSWVGLALTVAAGVFLLIWWARHFREARRARKLVDVDDVEEAVAIATGEVPAVGNAGVGPRV